MFWRIMGVLSSNSVIIKYYADHNDKHPTAAGVSAVLVMSAALMVMGLTTTAITVMAIFDMLGNPVLLAASGLIIAGIGFIMQALYGVIGEWLGRQKPRKESSIESE